MNTDFSFPFLIQYIQSHLY